TAVSRSSWAERGALEAAAGVSETSRSVWRGSWASAAQAKQAPRAPARVAVRQRRVGMDGRQCMRGSLFVLANEPAACCQAATFQHNAVTEEAWTPQQCATQRLQRETGCGARVPMPPGRPDGARRNYLCWNAGGRFSTKDRKSTRLNSS